jgi:hypothetical protein
MKFAEKVFIVFGLIGIGMRLLNIGGGSLFVVLALLCLACLYLFCGFIFYNNIQLRHVFSKAGYTGVSPSRIIVGIISGVIHFIMLASVIFRIQNWYGNAVLLLAALAVTFVHALILFVISFRTLTVVCRPVLIRSVVMLVLGLVLLLAPGIHFERPRLPDYQQKKTL